ncbi:MAG: TonB-dependent receptor, partial [Gammaproteobacteria bacterium]|nr:TonB-dependent receptor [Gammaproteobacteria bacterium]
DVGADTMLYATVSTGFLAGNQQGAFNGTNSYDEQTVTAFELGSKSLLADGRVRLNASFYVNQFEDLLATRFVDAGATTLAFTDNAGEIDAIGLEVELDWAVTDQLQLGARASMQQAEYGDFALPNVFQEGGETISGIANQFQLDGLQVQNSPDFTATLLGSYLVDLGGSGTLIPSITVYYSSDYRVDDSNWFFGNQDAYTKTDLSVTWASVNQDWTARLWVTNLEDEATLLKATRFGGDVAVTDYANPRMWGLTVGYRY